VPQKQPEREQLWRVDGSCMRLRPGHREHTRDCCFVEERTYNGQKLRMLNARDEFSRDCFAITVWRPCQLWGVFGGPQGITGRVGISVR
jgi:hypothetical protein